MEVIKITQCSDRQILCPCDLTDLNYQVDTYVGCEHCCCYCYVLADAETDWSEEIRTHRDVVDRLSAELDKISPQRIYMGYYTDPYQPCETDCLQTRKVLELFLQKGFSASILTKSDLIVRDLDLLRKMGSASVSVSVAFNDDRTRRFFEANTMETEKRIDALRQIKAAGVRTGALVCPVIPYITDAIELTDMLHAHADTIWIYGLSIDDRLDQNWINVEKVLDDQFPDLADQIKSAIFSKEHHYWVQLRQRLEALKNDRQLNLNIRL